MLLQMYRTGTAMKRYGTARHWTTNCHCNCNCNCQCIEHLHLHLHISFVDGYMTWHTNAFPNVFKWFLCFFSTIIAVVRSSKSQQPSFGFEFERMEFAVSLFRKSLITPFDTVLTITQINCVYNKDTKHLIQCYLRPKSITQNIIEFINKFRFIILGFGCK